MTGAKWGKSKAYVGKLAENAAPFAGALFDTCSDADLIAEADRRNVRGLPVYYLDLLTVIAETVCRAEVDFRTDPPTVRRYSP